MMKRWMGLLAALLALACLGGALAETYIGQRPPESWADRETLLLSKYRYVQLNHLPF